MDFTYHVCKSVVSHFKKLKTAVLSGAPQNRWYDVNHWRGVEGSREYFRLKCRIKAFSRNLLPKSRA